MEKYLQLPCRLWNITDLLQPNVKGPKNVALFGWDHVHIKEFGKSCTALSI